MQKVSRTCGSIGRPRKPPDSIRQCFPAAIAVPYFKFTPAISSMVSC
jgi:hypothetical protein